MVRPLTPRASVSRELVISLLLPLLVPLVAEGDHVEPSAIVPSVPRDAIPPLDAPTYRDADEINWLTDDDRVLAFEHEGEARAYPLRIMRFHEIVNDTVNDAEVLISYCPLCLSGIVFDRRLREASGPTGETNLVEPDAVLAFGNTGKLYESNLVLYDRATGSQWYQVRGEALTGPLHGVELAQLPSAILTWAQWREAHPEGRVLSRETGYNRAYAEAPVDNPELERGGEPAFSVSHRDEQAKPKTRVLGLNADGATRAYDLTQLPNGAYADTIDDEPVALFIEDGTGVAYRPPIVDGQLLTFVSRDDAIVDEQTGSAWTLTGKAVSGELAGRTLNQLPQTAAFWFSWAVTHPDTELVRALSDLNPYRAPPSQPSTFLVLALLVGGMLLVLAISWGATRQRRL